MGAARSIWGIVLVAGACGSSGSGPLVCGDPARGPAWTQLADVTGSSGLAFQYTAPDFRGGAIAAADLDGDGLPEVIAGRRTGGLAVFHNLGGMHFAPVTDSGIDLTLAVSAIAAVDLDNDGDRDLVLAGPGLAVVMANQGDGTFRQVQQLETGATPEEVLPVDLDHDGKLDLYFVDHDEPSTDGSPDVIYMNRGGLQFAFASTAGAGLGWSATAFDFDGDGAPDIYLANDTLVPDFGPDGPHWPTNLPPDALLRNCGSGAIAERSLSGASPPPAVPRFMDLASTLGLATPRSSMGGVLGDFDVDGKLDLFVPNEGAKKLFVRAPDGSFVDRAPELGLAAINRRNAKCRDGTTDEDCMLFSWSAAFTDFDLDGHDELLVVDGVTGDAIRQPALLFVADPGGGYHEESPALGCIDARGLVATDLDGDGDQDLLLAQNVGPLVAYENQGTPAAGTWLDVRLAGTRSNREGVGAIVTAHLASGRTLVKAVGAGGVIESSAPAEAFFGLGSETVESLDVAWPSGQHSTVAQPGSGLVHVIEP